MSKRPLRGDVRKPTIPTILFVNVYCTWILRDDKLMYILNRFPFFRVRLILFVKRFKTKGLNNPIKPTYEGLC